MSEIFIRVEVTPGAHLQDVAQQAQDLADRAQICVRFTFGGVECTAVPGGTGERLAASWLYEVQTPLDRGCETARAYSTPRSVADADRPMPGSHEAAIDRLFARDRSGGKDDQGPASC